MPGWLQCERPSSSGAVRILSMEAHRRNGAALPPSAPLQPIPVLSNEEPPRDADDTAER